MRHLTIVTRRDRLIHMEIALTQWEYKACVDVAVARMATSINGGFSDIHHSERGYMERLKIDVLGACGELAVAKAVNQFWSPSVNTMHKGADVGTDIEVRTTDKPDNCLIVREEDNPDRWYFLVIGNPPHMSVRGFIRGRNARQDAWLRNPHGHRPAWFVPQEFLLKVKGDR